MAEALDISPCALARWLERQDFPSPGNRRGRRCLVDGEARARIRECYTSHFGQWGPQVLAAWCRRKGLGDWCAGTVAAVIADLQEPEEENPSPIRYEITATGVMWSEDGTGFLQRGRKQELLVVQDEHSRRKLNWDLADGPATSQDVRRYLEKAFKKYGPPLVLKRDGDAIFHTPEVSLLLAEYQVLDLTSPPGHPGYNGKQERSMRDIKSYERAMRKHGEKGTLANRIRVTMKDLNDDRPRPVLGGRTAREAYNEGLTPLPDRKLFRKEVESRERKLLSMARSRSEVRKARRLAIEQTLMCYGLMEIEGDVSHDFLLEVGTK
jgi:transposase InsO family protein